MNHVTLRAFSNELEKIAVTRGVQEWRAAMARGDEAAANQIAQGYGQLGARPRYLKDVSLGGQEAGVDLMMGHAPALGPRMTENPSGLVARKLYKPDSPVSQAEFTPQLLEEKLQATRQARGLSPEARALMPEMYGYQTTGAGTPLQRSMSYHEYVPGIQDIRGARTSAGHAEMPQAYAEIARAKAQLLDPMAQRGQVIGDVVTPTGVNWGNIAHTPQGTKIIDFLPYTSGEISPAQASYMKYAPAGTEFAAGAAKPSLGALRKEVFKPTMATHEASPALRHLAREVMMGNRPELSKGTVQNLAQIAQTAERTAVPPVRAAAGLRRALSTIKPTAVTALSHM